MDLLHTKKVRGAGVCFDSQRPGWLLFLRRFIRGPFRSYFNPCWPAIWWRW